MVEVQNLQIDFVPNNNDSLFESLRKHAFYENYDNNKSLRGELSSFLKTKSKHDIFKFINVTKYAEGIQGNLKGGIIDLHFLSLMREDSPNIITINPFSMEIRKFPLKYGEQEQSKLEKEEKTVFLLCYPYGHSFRFFPISEKDISETWKNAIHAAASSEIINFIPFISNDLTSNTRNSLATVKKSKMSNTKTQSSTHTSIQPITLPAAQAVPSAVTQSATSNIHTPPPTASKPTSPAVASIRPPGGHQPITDIRFDANPSANSITSISRPAPTPDSPLAPQPPSPPAKFYKVKAKIESQYFTNKDIIYLDKRNRKTTATNELATGEKFAFKSESTKYPGYLHLCCWETKDRTSENDIIVKKEKLLEFFKEISAHEYDPDKYPAPTPDSPLAPTPAPTPTQVSPVAPQPPAPTPTPAPPPAPQPSQLETYIGQFLNSPNTNTRANHLQSIRDIVESYKGQFEQGRQWDAHEFIMQMIKNDEKLKNALTIYETTNVNCDFSNIGLNPTLSEYENTKMEKTPSQTINVKEEEFDISSTRKRTISELFVPQITERNEVKGCHLKYTEKDIEQETDLTEKARMRKNNQFIIDNNIEDKKGIINQTTTTYEDFQDFFMIMFQYFTGNNKKIPPERVNIDFQHQDSIKVKVNSKSFDLIGMIFHDGENPNSGHYVAHMKNSSNQWRLISDKNINPLDNNNIFKYEGNNPYLMLYYDSDKQLPDTDFIGIMNTGNTCYMNSAMQLLTPVYNIIRNVAASSARAETKITQNPRKLLKYHLQNIIKGFIESDFDTEKVLHVLENINDISKEEVLKYCERFDVDISEKKLNSEFKEFRDNYIKKFSSIERLEDAEVFFDELSNGRQDINKVAERIENDFKEMTMSWSKKEKQDYIKKFGMLYVDNVR